MKKTLLFMLCFSCISAFAQDGWFLQPVIGEGISKIKLTIPVPTYPIKYAVTDEARIDIGCNTGRLVLGTGLGYMRTGYANNFDYTDLNGGLVATGNSIVYYNHIIIPVNAGYKFGGKKFSFIPAIGIDIAYNYSAVEVISGYGPTVKTKEPAANFKNEYNPISAFGMLKLGLDFTVSHRVSIVIIPKADYMLGNIFKKSASYGGDIAQHNYSFMLDAGIKWNFAKPREKAVASDTK